MNFCNSLLVCGGFFLTLSSPAQPVITVPLTNQVVIAGSSLVLAVGVGGTGLFSYQWQFNGTNLPNNLITTVAGNGNYGYAGDNGPATNASLTRASCCVWDSDGNLFIADTGTNRIRKVDLAGNITTIAGTGTAAYSGDGGPATNACINQPLGMAFDNTGILYFADSYNHCVRSIDASGIIRTIAGTGLAGTNGDTGPATNALLSSPTSLAFDTNGNLFILDSIAQNIRKVDSAGIITTLASPAVMGWALVFDRTGRLLIGDALRNQVLAWDPSGTLIPIAGNGGSSFITEGAPATNAAIGSPQGLAVDPAGNLYLTDRWDGSKVHRVDTNGLIYTVAGTGIGGYSGDGGDASAAQLALASGLATDNFGNLAVVVNGRVRVIWFGGLPQRVLTRPGVEAEGTWSVTVTSSEGSTNSSANLFFPASIRLEPADLTVSNGSPVTLTVVAAGTGPFAYQWMKNGTNLSDTATMTGTASPALSFVPAALEDTGEYSVQVSNLYGGVISRSAALNVITPVPLEFTVPLTNVSVNAGQPFQLSAHVSGTGPYQFQWFFNGNPLNSVIRLVGGTGDSGFSGDGGAATNATFDEPYGVACAHNGTVYVSDYWNEVVRAISQDGMVRTVAGIYKGGLSMDGVPGTNSALYNPKGLALDSAGNLFIGTQSTVRRLDTNGIITTVAGGGSIRQDGVWATNSAITSPQAVAVDSKGNLYISDMFTRIRRVDRLGIITTFAGNGTSGFSGDGGNATEARIFVQALCCDRAGNVLFADSSYGRIRRVDTNGIITTIAGNGGSGFSGDGGPATNAELNVPVSVAADSFGNVLIGSANRIRQIDTNGIIQTVAGNGILGSTGDGGPALYATLGKPTGLAPDKDGYYIVDYSNNRIRHVDPANESALDFALLSSRNAGDYSVIVSSPFSGSITSSVATLTVLPSILPAPQFVSWSWVTNKFKFTWSTTPTVNYQLQYTTDPRLNNWSNFSLTPVVATSNTMSAYDYTTGTKYFYRIQMTVP